MAEIVRSVLTDTTFARSHAECLLLIGITQGGLGARWHFFAGTYSQG